MTVAESVEVLQVPADEASPPPQGTAPYVVLAGNGSSGSKRLLRVLDMSDRTHCRMEPNRPPESPFRKLPSPWLTPPDQNCFGRQWDDAVKHAWTRYSDVDRLPPPFKRHLRGLSRRLGLWHLVSHQRVRQAIGLAFPSLGSMEWKMPGWLGTPSRLAEALLVLKINKAPGWMQWLLSHRPEARVIHVVRHPAAYIHSWKRRFVAKRNMESVGADCRARLAFLAEHSPQWRDRFGDIGRLSASEAEFWSWRYVVETTHLAGLASASYFLVADEQFVADPMAESKRIYEHCGLPWSPAAEQHIAEHQEHWRSRLKPAAGLLEPSDEQAVNSVLADSLMRDWWLADLSVSLSDYVA